MRLWCVLLLLLSCAVWAKPVEVRFSTLPPDCLVTSLDGSGLVGTGSQIRLEPFRSRGTALRFRLSKEGYLPLEVTLPADAFTGVDGSRVVWPPQPGSFLKLDPQLVAVTFHTSPSGAQIWASRSGSTDDYLGVTGQPILLNLADLLGPSKEGHFRLRLVAPGYQSVEVPVPRYLFGQGAPNRWPTKGEYALAPESGVLAPLLFYFRLKPWLGFLAGLSLLSLTVLLGHLASRLARSVRRARAIEARVASAGAELSGSRLGPYRLYEAVGRGASATVFRAEREAENQQSHQTSLAVKVFRLGKDALERLVAEVKPQLGLRHRNILPLLDWGQSGEFTYLVTEYVQGRTLREELALGQMRPEVWRRLADDLLGGLAYAHERGVVHGDVKPENLLLPLHGSLKLLDFGFARSVLSPGLGRYGGTPGYMAPEAMGAAATALSDQYSAGVVLREAWQASVLKDEPTPGEGLSLQAVLEKMTDAVPGKRWSDLEEARQALLSAYDRRRSVVE